MKLYVPTAELKELPELLALARDHVREREYERAVDVYGRLLELLAEVDGEGVADQKAAVRLARAHLFIQLGEWQRALEELDRVLAGEASLGDRALGVRARVAVSQVHANYGEYGEAVHNLQRALALAEEHGGPREQALVQAELGTVYARIGEHPLGMKSLDRVLELLEGQPLDAETAACLAAAYTQQGLAAFREGRAADAQERYERSLAVLGEHAPGTLLEADDYRYLGILASIRGSYSEALRYHRRALEIFKAMRAPLGQAKTFNSIGHACLDLSRLDEALYFMTRAQRMCRDLGADAEMATIYGKLGTIHRQREEHDRAVELHLKDVELCRRFGNYRALAFAIWNLGLSYRAKGDGDEALRYLRESLGRFEELQDRIHAARLRLDLAEVWLDRGRLPEAEREIEAAAEVLDAAEGPDRARVRKMLGTLNRLRQRWDEAEKHYREALEVLGGSDPSGRLAEVHYELAQLCSETGEGPRALANLKQAIRLARELGMHRLAERAVRALERMDELVLVDLLIEESESLEALEEEEGSQP